MGTILSPSRRSSEGDHKGMSIDGAGLYVCTCVRSSSAAVSWCCIQRDSVSIDLVAHTSDFCVTIGEHQELDRRIVGLDTANFSHALILSGSLAWR
jgi:hypothetical protein